MRENTLIYVLVDPRDLKVRYVGITNQSLKDRLGNHIHDAKCHPDWNLHKSRWIMQLLNMNLKPLIRCIHMTATRQDAENIEASLITKYMNKHNLVNISLGNGEFTSVGQKSAAELNSKTVYVYDYQGNYIKTFKSAKECSMELNICYSSVLKCLRGQYKYIKGYQLNFEKLDKMPSLENYGTGTSKEVTILDNETGKLLKFKNIVTCKEKLKLAFKSTSFKYLLGALNKEYGTRYSLFIDGKFKQSDYYNTGVLIECSDKTYQFKSKKNLLKYMGYKVKSIDEKHLLIYIKNYFKNLVNIELNRPLCLVTDEDN